MADQVYAVNHTFQAAAVATGAGEALDVGGLPAVGVQVSGITDATVIFEAKITGATWYAVRAINLNTSAKGTTTAADGLFLVPVGGFDQLQCRISAWVGGTITITGKAVLAAILVGEDASGDPETTPALAELGLTELVGINEQVDQNEYGASVAVALGATMSGELLSFVFYSTEDGSGAVQEPAGVLLVLDADPATSAGDAAIDAAERVTVIGHVVVSADDWKSDANGASQFVYNQPVPFHALASLAFVWFHEDATSLNDVAGDDEQLELNAWLRRDT